MFTYSRSICSLFCTKVIFFRFGSCCKILIMLKLGLQREKKAFHGCMVVAVSAATHARREAVSNELPLKLAADIGTTAVEMK